MSKERNRGRGGGGGGSGNGGRGGRGARPSASSSAKGSDGSNKAVPANWPPNVTYITTPYYAGISPRQRQILQTQPADLPGAPASTRPLPEIPSILRFGPSPLVEIRIISDPSHPAYGQRGLFAAKNLPAGSFILPYLGVYHRGNASVGGRGTNLHNKRESDYDLWLDRDADVAVDADRQGNEARFVNDYRGTGKARPNAEFREVWDPRRGERGMAVFVLPSGKRALASGTPSGGIAKGDEILVSYGKGFWEMRQKEAEISEGKKEEDVAKQEPGSPKSTSEQSLPGAVKASESSQCPNQDTETERPAAKTDSHILSREVEYISDRMGSLKVVAKIPRNTRFA